MQLQGKPDFDKARLKFSRDNEYFRGVDGEPTVGNNLWEII